MTFRGDNHSGRMFPYPMVLTADNDGFTMSYRPNANMVSGPNQVNTGPVLTHMRVGFIGQNSNNTSVDGYGDWHATFRQTIPGDVLRATTASGSPFLFLERQGITDFNFYNQGTSRLNAVFSNADVAAISITADPMNNVGSQAHIGIFFPPGTTINGTAIPGFAGNTGGMAPFGANFNANVPDAAKFITVAILPDPSQATLNLFAQKAFNFITGTTHTYTFDEANAMLTTNFNITTTNVYGAANTGTLQALYRHQWLYSTQATGPLNTGLAYYSPRGEMRLINSNTFQTLMPHPGILPNLGWANTGNRNTLNNYINAYANGLANMANAADGYNKDDFMELITNVQIAKQIGNIAAFNTILNQLRLRLQDWLISNDANYNRYFGYSPLFNHMSHYPNGFGSSGTFVDAHFHVGYFVMAAAILARYDQGFVNNYGDMVETVIRSIDNETKDMTDPGANGTVRPWFPYLKYFDPYAGHSWADAMANDQESVSEAINFAAGVFLWGETTGNNVMRDLGALLYITEAEAARQYWFDVDNVINGAPFANAYNHQHLTMLYNWGGNYATFFGIEPEWIHGITYVPMTGASTWLGTNVAGAAADFAQIGQNYAQWADWGQAINAQHAMHNPAAAIVAFNANNGLWPGSKMAYTYHWIRTFDSVGTIDATVRANNTGYHVFTKGACKHYMVYMPKGKGPKVVNFTDGRTFNVPDDTVIVYKVCPPLPVELINFEAKNIRDEYALMLWSTAWEKNNSYFEVQQSSKGTDWISIGTIPGKGNSSETSQYQFEDYHPVHGINYYRLKQVDFNGEFSYSKIKAVPFGKDSDGMTFYPNPVETTLMLKFSLLQEMGYDLVIKDVLSRIVYTIHLEKNTSGEYFIDLSHLISGVYLFELQNKVTDEKITGKLVKK
ncbi:MAG: T9SS type A sorting domain-containing protein [Cytophagaceae bacterium]|nr:T9SS type A sorting domain-containing protein [Cytophagaceae bacterium]